MARMVLRPPQLRTLDTDERSATWTELFYDLVFVVAVARLAARFLHGVSLEGFVEFIALFTVLWWGWASFTFFADRYDTDDAVQRLLAVAQMVGVAGMAAAVGVDAENFEASSRPFGASYAWVRLMLVLMYWRAWRHVRETQPLVAGYLKGFSAEVALWALSLVVPVPFRYLLWGLALFVSFATPWVMRREQVRVPLSASHLPERFGLFTILVLGESIAAAVVGVEHEQWALPSTIAGIGGVVMASSLWWLYFDNLEGSVVRRDPGRRHDWRPTAWIYSHLPLAAALTIAGVGVEVLILSASHPESHLAHRWVVVAGIAGAYVSMAMILASSTSAGPVLDFRRKLVLRLGAAVLLVALGAFGRGLHPVTFSCIVATLCAIHAGADTAAHGRAPRPPAARSHGSAVPVWRDARRVGAGGTRPPDNDGAPPAL